MRWGVIETLVTGCFAVVLFLVEARLTVLSGGDPSFAHLLMRATYLLLLTTVLALVARYQRTLRVEGWFLARVLRSLAARPGLNAGVRVVLGEVLELWGARSGVLLLQALDADHVYTWRGVTANERQVVVAGEMTDSDLASYRFADPEGVKVWHVVAEPSGRLTGRGIGEDAMAWPTQFDGEAARSLLASEHATEALGVDSEVGAGEWYARVLLFEPQRTHLDDLRFLATLVGQVTPALYNEYLAQRLRSRVSTIERSRIAHELHDGLVQSLIGLEMELEALRTKLAPMAEHQNEVARLRDSARSNVQEARDLMMKVRPVGTTGRDVLRFAAELVDRLRRDTGMEVTLMSTLDDIDCTPRVCADLIRIVHEALRNARKHSRARAIAISFSRSEDTYRMAVEDDGRGFPFEGRRTLAQLEATESGPRMITERVRAIGGTLTIDSQRGRGTRLDVAWPTRRR
jgi:signal transduction histidine kinase